MSNRKRARTGPSPSNPITPSPKRVCANPVSCTVTDAIYQSFRNVYGVEYPRGQFVGLLAYICNILRPQWGYAIHAANLDEFVIRYGEYHTLSVDPRALGASSSTIPSYHHWFAQLPIGNYQRTPILTADCLRQIWRENVYTFLHVERSLRAIHQKWSGLHPVLPARGFTPDVATLQVSPPSCRPHTNLSEPPADCTNSASEIDMMDLDSLANFRETPESDPLKAGSDNDMDSRENPMVIAQSEYFDTIPLHSIVVQPQFAETFLAYSHQALKAPVRRHSTSACWPS